MPKLITLRKATMMVFFCGFLGLLASSAKADSFTYVIDIPNSGLSGSPAPYANVALTQVFVNQGSTVCTALAPCINVNVQMLTNASGGTYQLFGSGGNPPDGAFGFNIVGSTDGLAVTNLTSNTGSGAASGFTFAPEGGHFNGFGEFELALGGPPASGALDFATFTVSRTGGFSTANDLFEVNAGGRHFAIHIAPTNGNPTGYAVDGGGTTIQQVPEPTSMLLLTTGLIGVARGIRRRKSARE